MSHLVNYIGCFVSPEELMEKLSGIREDGLENTIKTPHVTFAYRPEAVDRNLFGEKVGITIIGYGNDGTNEGVLTTLHTHNPALREMMEKIQVPHITIAVGEGGKPVNTRYLSFPPVTPVELEGTFGAYLGDGTVLLDSHA